MSLMPYIGPQEFSIPPKPGDGNCQSIPFIPTVPTVLSFFQGKIGIYEKFLSEILKENLTKANNNPGINGGPEFGNQQPPSKSQLTSESVNSILNQSQAPSGVGLESIEVTLLRTFAEGFKPILELVLIFMDLLKLLEDIISRVLSVLAGSWKNPANIPWALNAQEYDPNLIIDDLQTKPKPNLSKDVNRIKDLIDKATQLFNNATSIAAGINTTDQRLNDIATCALCDIEILKKELNTIECLINQTKPDFKLPKFDKNNQGKRYNQNQINSLYGTPIKEAIYLGYFTKDGNPINPPSWIRNSKKWKGQFEWIKDNESEGHSQLRRLYESFLNKANDIARKNITSISDPYADLRKKLFNDYDTTATSTTKDTINDCCDDDLSSISNSIDKYLKPINNQGVKYKQDSTGIKDLSGSINSLKNKTKNFNFIDLSKKELDNYDFIIRNEKNERIDSEWNLAYNNVEASQIASQNPVGVPDKIKHKILYGHGIDPEVFGRIRVIRVSNLPKGISSTKIRQITTTNNNKIYNNNGDEAYLNGLFNTTDYNIFIRNKNFGAAIEIYWDSNNIFYAKTSGGSTYMLRPTDTNYELINPAFYEANKRFVNVIQRISATNSANNSYGVSYNSGGNIPTNLDLQLFLNPNDNPYTAPLYNNGNTPFVIEQGIDNRDVGFFVDLYYLALGKTRRPSDLVINGLLPLYKNKLIDLINKLLILDKVPDITGKLTQNIDVANLPTHYYLVELLPGDPKKTLNLPSNTQNPTDAQKNVLKYSTRRNSGGDYSRLPTVFTIIPVFFLGIVNIVISRLVPLLNALVQVATNPISLLTTIIQNRLGQDIALFSPNLTTDFSLSNNYVFFDNAKKILSTVIDGVAILEIPGLLIFGFDIRGGKLRFIFQKANGCITPSPIVQSILSIATLPIQLSIGILESVFDFLSSIASPYKIPSAVAYFLSFQWLFKLISPPNILLLLGLRFKTQINDNSNNKEYDPIKETQDLATNFTRDMNELGALIEYAYNNRNSTSNVISRPSNTDIKNVCDCLVENDIKRFEKVFPNETQLLRLGDTTPLLSTINNICNDYCSDKNFSSANELVEEVLKICDTFSSNQPIQDFVGESGGNINTNLYEESSPINKNLFTNNDNINTPDNRDVCIDFKIKDRLTQLTGFKTPLNLYKPRFDLSLPDIAGLSLEELKMLNPAQFAFLPPNIDLSINPNLAFNLQFPQLIDLNLFIGAPFFTKLPKYTIQELINLTFLPLDMIASFIKLWEDLINGIIAFVMGCFGLDCIFPLPKLRLHCAVPKFIIDDNLRLKRIPRCDDDNIVDRNSILFRQKGGISNLVDLNSNMDINSLYGGKPLSSTLNTVESLIASDPESKPLIESCGCTL